MTCCLRGNWTTLGRILRVCHLLNDMCMSQHLLVLEETFMAATVLNSPGASVSGWLGRRDSPGQASGSWHLHRQYCLDGCPHTVGNYENRSHCDAPQAEHRVASTRSYSLQDRCILCVFFILWILLRFNFLVKIMAMLDWKQLPLSHNKMFPSFCLSLSCLNELINSIWSAKEKWGTLQHVAMINTYCQQTL